MDLIFSLIVECLIDLITGEAVDAATGSDRTKGWSKSAKVILIIVAFLIIKKVASCLIRSIVAIVLVAVLAYVYWMYLR